MTELHILEIQMPVGTFCAFSGSFRSVRYFAPFLEHAEQICIMTGVERNGGSGVGVHFLHGVATRHAHHGE